MFERRLRRRNQLLGEGSGGAVEAPSKRSLKRQLIAGADGVDLGGRLTEEAHVLLRRAPEDGVVP